MAALHPIRGWPVLCLQGLLGRAGPGSARELSASALACCPQLFLKEHLHQLLEGMRDHVLCLAAITLQRCLRGFFVQRRFRSLRRKIILLQSRARGYLARCRPRVGKAPWVSVARPQEGRA